jgi:hypothetical protein
MLIAIAIIFLLLWALGLATSFTLGGFIHLFLALAVITVLIRVFEGKKKING